MVARLQESPSPWPEFAVIYDIRWVIENNMPLEGRGELAKRWGWHPEDAKEVLSRMSLWWLDHWGPLPENRRDLERRIKVTKRMYHQDATRTAPDPDTTSPGDDQDADGTTVVYDEDSPGRHQDGNRSRPGHAHARVTTETGRSIQDQRRKSPLTPAGGRTRRLERGELNENALWVRDHGLELLRRLEHRGDMEALEKQRRQYVAGRMEILVMFQEYIEGREVRTIHGQKHRVLNAPDAPVGLRQWEIIAGLKAAGAMFEPSDEPFQDPELPFYGDDDDGR